MEKDSKISLAGIELLSELSSENLATLEKRVRFRRYEAKELIFDLESGGTEVYFIVKGKVQVVNYSPSGREVSFAEMPRGDTSASSRRSTGDRARRPSSRLRTPRSRASRRIPS